MKYKIGDRVRVKTWATMAEEYGIDSDGDIITFLCFTQEMEEMVEKTNRVVTIENVGFAGYEIVEDGYIFVDEMIEGLAEDKPNTGYCHFHPTVPSLVHIEKDYFTGELCEDCHRKNLQDELFPEQQKPTLKVETDTKADIIYLASPYSHENPNIVKRRFHHVCYIAGKIINDGLFVYSPIAHSHPIAQQGVADTWDKWQPLDLTMLSRCDKLWVATMAGWDKSVGVLAEIAHAQKLGIPVEHVPQKYLTF